MFEGCPAGAAHELALVVRRSAKKTAPRPLAKRIVLSIQDLVLRSIVTG
ncbi:hypothetical protein SAMN05444163_8045 [Bradyrhizobium ottawaense]|uniref:Uncharacterized protein n=1 Tax=Bradyrhizobium ottawaense TaxID=931866 RepID=A0ABY0QH54_9BRAD|nr:hypothetical protein SAMN05444163_8045 [Bradyrhizobium ottawaense]